jgi:hypothetical protein
MLLRSDFLRTRPDRPTKPKKKSTPGSVTTSGTTQAGSAKLYINSNIYDNVLTLAAPPENGSFFYAFNSDYTISGADLQSLLTYLHTGLGSTSAVTSTGGADLQAFITELKPGHGSANTVTTTNDINGDVPFANFDYGISPSILSANIVTDGLSTVPEPTSAILAGCGLVALLAAKRRLRINSAS